MIIAARNAGPGRRVARALEQVVLALVAGHPRLQERPGEDQRQQQDRRDLARQHDVPGPGRAEDVRLPAGHDPQQALGDAHVPVGLRAGGHLRRVVGAVLPDRVDRQQATHQRGHAEDDEEEPAGLGGVDRQHREADDVLLGAAGTGPLGVLVVDEQQHVGGDQRQDQARDQQHVGDVEPRDDHLARELAAEHEERHVRCRRTGVALTRPSAIRRPVPESRSSGSE